MLQGSSSSSLTITDSIVNIKTPHAELEQFAATALVLSATTPHVSMSGYERACCSLFESHGIFQDGDCFSNAAYPQESHSSRLEQKKKQSETQTKMESEMTKFAALKATQSAKKEEDAKVERERQRSSIATPGQRTPLMTPRRKTFGL